ncbi:glycosyltransferase [Empedobacter falsenii]
MINQPLVSIIIPTYNRAELIGETLDSVLAQTYQNWECIVVDDGSTDHTSDVLDNYTKKDSRISYHHRPKQYKPGGNGARNYGFDLSKGEYINWFDSDDVMLEDFITDKITNIENNDLIICAQITVDSNLKALKTHTLKIKNNILYDYLVWGNNFDIVTNNILFCKKFLLDKKYKFNEDILRGQETDFLLRIFSKELKDLKYTILDKPLFLYRQHALTKTSENNKKIKKFNYSLLYTHFQKLSISKEFKFSSIETNNLLKLKGLSIKIIKERDFNSLFFTCEKLFKIKTINSLFLSVSLFVLFFINKTPKVILNNWEKI